MAISFALQDMVHEGAVVAVGQRDFSVTELMLQAAVEEAEQELIGQTGRAVNLLLILHCYEQKGEDTNEKKQHSFTLPYHCKLLQKKYLFHDRCILYSL